MSEERRSFIQSSLHINQTIFTYQALGDDVHIDSLLALNPVKSAKGREGGKREPFSRLFLGKMSSNHTSANGGTVVEPACPRILHNNCTFATTKKHTVSLCYRKREGLF